MAAHQRVKLNDHTLLYDQSGGAFGEMMDGARLRDIAREAILNDGSSVDDNMVMEMMDDDEAEEARKYFGVF